MEKYKLTINAEEYFRTIEGIKRMGKSLNMPVEVWDSAIFYYDKILGDVKLV